MPSFTATAVVVKMNSDGSVVVNLALTEIGQGSATAVGQIAAETLGFPLSKVKVADRDGHRQGAVRLADGRLEGPHPDRQRHGARLRGLAHAGVRRRCSGAALQPDGSRSRRREDLRRSTIRRHRSRSPRCRSATPTRTATGSAGRSSASAATPLRGCPTSTRRPGRGCPRSTGPTAPTASSSRWTRRPASSRS